MTSEPIVAFPSSGRAYEGARRVGPGEALASGRARLDEIVDWLQQIAYEDVIDVGLQDEAVWIVRRTRVRVERFPLLGELVTLRTACSGLGANAMWAERRTSMTGDRGAAVETAAIWVPLHPGTLHPVRSQPFLDVYAEAAGGRRVRAHLRHPRPPHDAERSPWSFRAADLDVAGHVNNAAYWRALEQELADHPPGAALEVEAEHHAPAPAGPAQLLRAGEHRWLTNGDGELRTSFALVRR